MHIKNKFIMTFLYSRIGQLISRFISGGWFFLDPKDPEIQISESKNGLAYGGDQRVSLDKGILSLQRKKWKRWIVLAVPPTAPFLVIVCSNGTYLACKIPVNQKRVAIRVGPDSAVVKLAKTRIDNEDFLLHPVLEFVWEESYPWPGGYSDNVKFL